MFGKRTSLCYTQAGQRPCHSERQQKLLRSTKDRGDKVMLGTHYMEDSGEEIDPREPETEERGRKRVGFSSDPKGKQVIRRGTTRSPTPLKIDEETFREMMEDVQHQQFVDQAPGCTRCRLYPRIHVILLPGPRSRRVLLVQSLSRLDPPGPPLPTPAKPWSTSALVCLFSGPLLEFFLSGPVFPLVASLADLRHT